MASSAALIDKQALLKRRIVEERVFVDNDSTKPIKATLSPYFISADRYKELASLSELVISAIEKFLRIYVESQEVQNLFPELSIYRDLTTIKPNTKHWIHMARFDVVESVTGEFKILETNTSCPVILLPTIVRKIHAEIGLLEHFREGRKVIEQPLDDPRYFIETLAELSIEIFNVDKPNVAFLTSSVDHVSTDINLMETIAEEMGLKSKWVDIKDLKFSEGRIYADKNMPIDVAYQKIRLDIVLEDTEEKFHIYEKEAAAFLEGIQRNLFICTNSMVSTLVAENKKILALITRPEFVKYFTDQENDAIRQLVPETLAFDSSNKNELLERTSEFLRNRQNYVIKKVFGTRGNAVWLGKDCSEKVWRELVGKLENGTFVIQEYIEQNTAPLYDQSEIPTLTNMYTTPAIYLIRGNASGMACRSSLDVVCSGSTSGGCCRVTYVVE